MNIGLSADGVAAGVALVTLLGGIVGAYLRQVDARQEERIKDVRDKLEAVEVERGHRQREFEKRIAEIEKTYISRLEQASFRAEIMTAIKDLGIKIDHILDRLGKVEAQ